MTVKPFRVTVRVRNNRIIRAREEMGFATAASFSRHTGIRQSALASYETMAHNPLRVAAELVHQCAADECPRRAAPARITCSDHREKNEELKKVDWIPRVWKDSALALAAALFREPEYLWPESVLAVKKSLEASIEVDAVEAALLGQEVRPVLDGEAMRDAVRASISRLTPVEQQIVRKRFGLDDADPLLLREVADELGMGIEGVRQSEQKALLKLRGPTSTKKLKPFY